MTILMPTSRLRDWLIAIAIAAALLLAPRALRAEDVGEADSIAARQVISQQIEAFKAGDHARAYSYAAPTIKDMFPTVDAFIAMVRGGYMPLYAPQSFQFGRDAAVADGIHQELIVTDASGRQWQAVYTLRRDADGAWKITGVKMNPWNGASA